MNDTPTNAPDRQHEITMEPLKGCSWATWSVTWQNFIGVETNRQWYQRWPTEQPVYALPEEVIKGLSQKGDVSQRRSATAILSKQDLESELNFTKCCRSWSADTVGVWAGRPIKHLLLGPESSYDVPDEWLKQMNWGGMSLERKKLNMRELGKEEAAEHRNLLRAAGDLDRGRDGPDGPPPAQIRTGGFPASGSYLGYRTWNRTFGYG
jgi:hypothetical protein